MKMEAILKQISIFKEPLMDMILFESTYPVLFTCTDGKEVFLFSCCLVNAKIMKWIGTKTSYDVLIQLLQDKITIRDAFLSVDKEMLVIEYDGETVRCDIVDKLKVTAELLPTAGEYMDVEDDEYVEEIAIFEERNKNLELKVLPRKNSYYTFTHSLNIVLTENFFAVDYSDVTEQKIGRISNSSIAYA